MPCLIAFAKRQGTRFSFTPRGPRRPWARVATCRSIKWGELQRGDRRPRQKEPSRRLGGLYRRYRDTPAPVSIFFTLGKCHAGALLTKSLVYNVIL